MKVAVLFSGGKDSCYALWKGFSDGLEITSLILVYSENPESWMFHYPNVRWTELQAKALGLPYTIVKTSGKKEEELVDLEERLKGLKRTKKIEAIISGAIASKYQKDRFEELSKRLGIKSMTPLWNEDQVKVVKKEIASFEIIMTACHAMGFNKEWLGKRMDLDVLNELIHLNKKYGINISGEGGEYETFVTDGPNFKEKIKILDFDLQWNGFFGYLIIKNAILEKK
ncbi:MAG: diphthine--ammonia ligase [Candidatus Bathyarchaeota archaeon]|nr:diphthine--ammonia ligase [Candidatus Bathyarchaeota archaeon]MCZ2846083.1 diphthine--ammonia ligase [Candidatus Bathyarchaeota archaeon]